MVCLGRCLRPALAVFICSFFPVSAQAGSGSLNDELLDRLTAAAPLLDGFVLEAAFNASRCAVSAGLAVPERLAVIDFSLPSAKKRLWIFDLNLGKLVLSDLVAHGKNSGNVLSTEFSNVEGSHQSSIGLFRGSESYYGKHGYSLRLDGLEPGFNDRARERAIVIHGAGYVNETWINRYGRIGRSHGCPAVDSRVIERVVDNLKDGQFVFKYYPDQEWLRGSEYLNCTDGTVAGEVDGTESGAGGIADKAEIGYPVNS
ncbi:murein L,D-transpeptidase catalytic domain family protein [Marinobacter arenosus]|uniref:murein L,D-transpeptidase catalytic domain family protein n=1 Tax=Marinobacter arenosus TaxID=2856822 RepID=UPI001C4C9F53|nr:murein L,D-transpeptidase catalytic domain family protein [Marinobacter arenosus]MBW0146027.1 murein L,D-transpeptidase catalytic domain family protein [Marinobacter arenosus]